ncbi:hypothetical protein DWF04_013390 [Cereibacter sphaeroides f. sp. denitrificans]
MEALIHAPLRQSSPKQILLRNCASKFTGRLPNSNGGSDAFKAPSFVRSSLMCQLRRRKRRLRTLLEPRGGKDAFKGAACEALWNELAGAADIDAERVIVVWMRGTEIHPAGSGSL